jgi:hypothetical protein
MAGERMQKARERMEHPVCLSVEVLAPMVVAEELEEP